MLQQLIECTQQRIGTRVDIILAGDFNRHDQLWGGDDISRNRQGEADPIIEFMGEFALHSLLQRGVTTWEGPEGQESTIDLVLVSDELAATTIRCKIHKVEHGSDHKAIETVFDIDPPERVVERRLLFKNAPWKSICDRIELAL
jgi:endonuclease/exonuclease/phosphatase family metal-dependent hydrolase